MRSSSADPPPESDSVTRVLAASSRVNLGPPSSCCRWCMTSSKTARARLAAESSGQSLQATALVHEAYLRLARRDPGVAWDGRGHFFAAAAEAMRRILVEKARARRRLRHGGGLDRVDLDQVASVGDDASGDCCDPRALDQLASEEPIVAEVVKLRYFAGLTTEQAALALGYLSAPQPPLGLCPRLALPATQTRRRHVRLNKPGSRGTVRSRTSHCLVDQLQNDSKGPVRSTSLARNRNPGMGDRRPPPSLPIPRTGEDPHVRVPEFPKPE